MPKEHIELSFDSNDDSDGHRGVMEFLQQRTGKIVRPLRVFNTLSKDRCSISVHLENLTMPSIDAVSIHVEHETEAEVMKSANIEGVTCTNVRISPDNSTHKPVVRKSVTLSGLNADIKRQYSLLRASCIKRHSLLTEFQNTINVTDFAPDVCSTPIGNNLNNVDLHKSQGTNTIPNSNAGEDFDGRNNERMNSIQIPTTHIQLANAETDEERNEGKSADVLNIEILTMSKTPIAKIIQNDFCVSDVITDDNDSCDDDKDKNNNKTENMPLDLVTEVKSVKKMQSRLKRSQTRLFPPLAVIRSRHERKNFPLNKAPDSPISGEKIAEESKTHLPRPSNCGILDLRNRKSLNRTFLIAECTTLVEPKEAEVQGEEATPMQMELPKSNLREDNELHDNGLGSEPKKNGARRDDCVFKKVLPEPDGLNDPTVPSAEENLSSNTKDCIGSVCLLDLDVLNNNLKVSSQGGKRRKHSEPEQTLHSKDYSHSDDDAIPTLQKSAKSNIETTMQPLPTTTSPRKKSQVQQVTNQETLSSKPIGDTGILKTPMKRGRKPKTKPVAKETMETSSVRRSNRIRTNVNESMSSSLPLYRILHQEVSIETFRAFEKELKNASKRKNNKTRIKKEKNESQKKVQHPDTNSLMGNTNSNSASSSTKQNSRRHFGEASKIESEHITTLPKSKQTKNTRQLNEKNRRSPNSKPKMKKI